MAAPKKIDYERIEPAWRAGIKSPAQLAAEYTEDTGVSVSHAAIIKHFKKLGVPRNLAAKVKAKADSMVMHAMVTGKVSLETTKADAQIINDSAGIVAAVRIGHRTDIARCRRLANKLLEELEDLTDNRHLFEELGEILHNPEDTRLSEAYHKVIALPSRTKTLKELGETLKNLITLERQAYDVGAEQPNDDRSKLTEEELDRRIAKLSGQQG